MTKLPTDPHELLELQQATVATQRQIATQIAQLRSKLQSAQTALTRFKVSRWKILGVEFYIALARLIRSAVPLPAISRGLAAFAIPFAMGVMSAIFVGPSLAVAFIGLGIFLAFVSTIPNDTRLVSLHTENMLQRANLDRQMEDIRAQVAEIQRQLAQASQQLQSVKKLLAMISATREARLAQFASQNWRALRGTQFEHFLTEVLRELGYLPSHTGKSGDQGADIICHEGNRKIVIQVKGYENSVGNSAVQQAFSARAYYDCDGCAVITNSVFTPAARDLAEKVGCLLIDKDTLPDLILGRFNLMDRALELAARASASQAPNGSQ